jgi:hypothetical protein
VALSRERRPLSCGSSRFVIVVQLFGCHLAPSSPRRDSRGVR